MPLTSQISSRLRRQMFTQDGHKFNGSFGALFGR